MKNLLRGLALSLVVAFVGVVMCACVPSNVEKAKAKLEEANYTILVAEERTDDKEGIIGFISAHKLTAADGYDTVTATLFDSKKSAQTYYEKYVGEIKEDNKIKISGKWVYIGTEAGVEAFEG